MFGLSEMLVHQYNVMQHLFENASCTTCPLRNKDNRRVVSIRFGKGLALSAKTRLLILAVSVGVVLFAIFYYLEGINYPYVIRYPILVATVILFMVIVATLVFTMGRRVGVPLPS